MKNRLYIIDLLRFFAALSVMFFHFYLVFYHDKGFTLVDNKTFNQASFYGNLGVQLFFVISGFVILMSALNQTPSQFVKARIVRLYPAFIPICVFTFVVATFFVQNFDVSLLDFILNLTLVGTFLSKKLVSGVYWTLQVEMQFYVLIFILIYFKKINKIRFFLNAWLILSLITYFGIEHFNYFRIFNKIRFIFITQYSFYFIGGCYFFLMRNDKKKYDVFIPLICLVGAILNAYYPKQDKLIQGIIITIIFALFYLVSFNKLLLKDRKWYYQMGEMTYPLYLVHSMLGVLLLETWYNYLPGWLNVLFVSIIVIILAHLICKYVEWPLRKWLKGKLQ